MASRCRVQKGLPLSLAEQVEERLLENVHNKNTLCRGKDFTSDFSLSCLLWISYLTHGGWKHM